MKWALNTVESTSGERSECWLILHPDRDSQPVPVLELACADVPVYNSSIVRRNGDHHCPCADVNNLFFKTGIVVDIEYHSSPVLTMRPEFVLR